MHAAPAAAADFMKFLIDPPQFLFFTGKGGVGKTSLACATAIYLAEVGKRVLLVSTDPASNVAQVLGQTIGNTITAISTVPGLFALEIDPEQAAEAYRERIIAPVRGLLPEREIASITEQLSGSCTTEVASFNEFTDVLADEQIYGQYDHVIFDTAPTGHTIRLLQLPGSWTDFLTAGKGDASCLGPLAGLDKQRTTYAAAVDALKDRARTRLVLVTRPQVSALSEVARTHHELDQIGIHTANLVINGVMPAHADDDALAHAIRQRETQAIAGMAPAVAALPRDVIELRAVNMVGLDALRLLLDEEAAVTRDAGVHLELPDIADQTLRSLVDEIETPGHGLILCMGKGGVGKTTIAASIAVALASRGHAVHLTTTDPAAHLTDVLVDALPNLRVSRIDPIQATQEYRDRVMASKGAKLDDAGRANLAEDLLSPCTEEVAVFQQFSKVVLSARHEFVVIDTAPTGHTLLLLDTTGSFHRDVVRQMGKETGVHTPLMLLQDPDLTKVVIVTLPEPTPVVEAQVLQDDLRRAGIEPWAWVVNDSFIAAHPTSAFLKARCEGEITQLIAVEESSPRMAIVPLLAQEPVGAELLLALTNAKSVRSSA